ncbi:MAG TPA: PTS sugar transporter subunit IIA [Thermoanaerobacterales bacterium]|nr:PTS sugar transporter subunit IIA [Thermoanaerobacterales bacterium]
MVGIVIAAHGELGTCLRKTVNLFMKDAENITSVDLTESSGPDKFVRDLEKAIHEVDSGKGVLILADLFGGTPANSAWKIISSTPNCQGVTGINLGMVLEVLFQRNETKTLSELVDVAKDAGVNSVRLLEPI